MGGILACPAAAELTNPTPLPSPPIPMLVQTVLFSQQDGARQEKAIVEAALASSVVHPHVVRSRGDMLPACMHPSECMRFHAA